MQIPSFQRLNWKQELRNILKELKIATKLNNIKLECHYIIIITNSKHDYMLACRTYE